MCKRLLELKRASNEEDDFASMLVCELHDPGRCLTIAIAAAIQGRSTVLQSGIQPRYVAQVNDWIVRVWNERTQTLSLQMIYMDPSPWVDSLPNVRTPRGTVSNSGTAWMVDYIFPPTLFVSFFEDARQSHEISNDLLSQMEAGFACIRTVSKRKSLMLVGKLKDLGFLMLLGSES